MGKRITGITETPRTSARSTPSVPPAAASEGDAAQSEEGLDIERIAKEQGPATEAEVMELVGEVSDEALVQEGRRVATPRVSKEAARLVAHGQRFFATASPTALLAVCMTPEVLRVVAWSAAEGHRAWRKLNAARSARRTTKVTQSAEGDAAAAAARGERDQIADALRKVATGNGKELARITAAVQPAAQGANETGPGQALTSLVTIGRGYLKSTAAGTKKRCAMWGVTAERLDAAAAIAAPALASERAASEPVDDLAHEQSVVDRWDGVNLVLIEYVARAFAKANANGKPVAKFRYVHLRGILGTRKTARKTPAKPVAPVEPR